MKLLEGRLINVSNRLPVEVKFRAGRARLNPSAGGLASALDSIWRHHHGLWIGWAGAVDPETASSLLQKAARGRSYGFKAVPLSQHEVSKFYSGFANEIIWPLFHDMPSRCDFDPEYWEFYQRVNRKFAQLTAELPRARRFFPAYTIPSTGYFRKAALAKDHIALPAAISSARIPD